MGVALSTVQQMLLHQDVCRVHTSSRKPTLTEENKMSRMELALSFIDKNNTSKFKNMEDLIHIDEKWFYLTKDEQHFIIAADKEEPYRHVQHKSFLTKIMFLCVVTTPRYNMRRNTWFDGKIGIWPSGNGSRQRGHRRSAQRECLCGRTNALQGMSIMNT